MIKKLLFSLLAIFGFTFLFSSNTFAASDVTYTIDRNNYNNIDLCNSSCSTYKYIYVHDINWNTTDATFNLYLSSIYDSQRVLKIYLYRLSLPTFLLYNVDLSNNFLTIGSGSVPNGDWSFKVTLSENNPTAPSCSEPSGSLNITENGTYDVTNYATAVVNVPSETIVTDLPPYSELVVDSFWKYHVAIAGGLASIFAIFVVYRIIKSRLR